MAEVVTMVTDRVSEYPALPTRLQQHLDVQRRAGQFCDVTLSVQDAKFNLHRCVLSAFSPHLTGMLNSAGSQGGAASSGTARATQLDLPELTRDGVTPVVNFMYTSKLVLTRDNIFAVSLAAGYFQIRELIQECQQYFQEMQQGQGQGHQGQSHPGGRAHADPGMRDLRGQFQTVSGSRMTSLQHHTALGTRVSPEQHQTALGTRVSPEQHQTALGTRVSPEQQQTALGTRILSLQHHTTLGTRMPSEQHHNTLGTRMQQSEQLQTTLGTRSSSGSMEVLSVDSSPGLQAPTSTSQQIYSPETGRNDHPGATAGHRAEDTLDTPVNEETATHPANFPPADFSSRVESSDEFSSEATVHQTNMNSEAIVVKQEPSGNPWVDFSEGVRNNQQEMDSYDMWSGGNPVLDDLDKPFQCMFCPKRLRTKSLLASHVRRHTGERPHACPLCFTKFPEKWRLTKHMRVHTGEKPYKCTQCPATFADASNRNKHRKRMHGTRGSNAAYGTPEKDYPVNHTEQIGMRANQLFSVPNNDETADLHVDTQENFVE
ncbi:uncharacterized protein LOC144907636 isoform X1 [Branchiostoma floridae x Branchiostoma belcheri]